MAPSTSFPSSSHVAAWFGSMDRGLVGFRLYWPDRETLKQIADNPFFVETSEGMTGLDPVAFVIPSKPRNYRGGRGSACDPPK